MQRTDRTIGTLFTVVKQTNMDISILFTVVKRTDYTFRSVFRTGVGHEVGQGSISLPNRLPGVIAEPNALDVRFSVVDLRPRDSYSFPGSEQPKWSNQ
jgi:hypothetical protein